MNDEAKQTAVIPKINAKLPSATLFEDDANAGFQSMSQEDLALPFLKVLGQLSPEVNTRHAKHMRGHSPV